MITRSLRGAQVVDEPTGFIRIAAGNAGERFIEIGEFLTVGRDTSNTLVLSDPCISQRHARIERKPIGFLLRTICAAGT